VGWSKRLISRKKKESLRWVRLETHLFELHRFQEMVQDAFETIQVSDQQVLFHLVILKMIIQLVIG
jgi:hypothetical protein